MLMILSSDWLMFSQPIGPVPQNGSLKVHLNRPLVSVAGNICSTLLDIT